MHICFVEVGYPRPSGEVGGAGTYVNNYGKQLVKMGHEVTVICGEMDNGTDFFKDDGISVFPIICPSFIAYYMSRIPFFRIYSRAFNYLSTGLKTYFFLKNLHTKNNISKAAAILAVTLIFFSFKFSDWEFDKKYRTIIHKSITEIFNSSTYITEELEVFEEAFYAIKESEKIVGYFVVAKAPSKFHQFDYYIIFNKNANILKIEILKYFI